MLVKLLGFIDLLAIISLLAVKILPQSLVIIMGLYLIIKGVLFMILGGSFTNLLDIISGFYIVAAAYSVSHWIITLIVIIYLGQKAFVSLL